MQSDMATSIWALSVAGLAAGLLLAAVRPEWGLLAGASVAVLLWRGLAARGKSMQKARWIGPGVAAGLLASHAYAAGGQRVALLLLAAQVTLATLFERFDDPRGDPASYRIPILGHFLMTASAAAAWWDIVPWQVFLAALPGTQLVAMDVMWRQRRLDPGHGGLMAWESGVLLVQGSFTTGAVIAIALGYTTWLSTAGWHIAWLVGAAAMLGLLSDPPHVHERARPERSDLGIVTASGLSLAMVFTALALLALLTWPVAVAPTFVALTAWLLVAVTLEYFATLRRFFHRRRHGVAADLNDLTVVICARNESDALYRSLPINLRRLRASQFVVCAAMTSTDDTLETARDLMRPYLGRGKVVAGPGTSKAVDLTLAWQHVKTPHVLVLDADEIVDPVSVALALDRMKDDPRIGILQGRKNSDDREATRVARMANAERRFSTLLDHPMNADVFDAAHFAGSGAIVRREVPDAVGYWNPTTLTEDIEFALRVHENTQWDLRYDPDFVIRETAPSNLRSLLRQRSRWARGWEETADIHLGHLMDTNRNLNPRQRFGLSWQLITAIHGPIMAFLPIATVLWYQAGLPLIGGAIGWMLALYILPSRGFAYVTALLTDQEADHRRHPARILGALVAAYLWIPLAWILQLDSAYREASLTPRHWEPTRA